jgi:hypothetical protein
MLHLVNVALSATYRANITGGKSPPPRAPLRSVPARNGAVPELIEVLEIAGVAAVNTSWPSSKAQSRKVRWNARL